MSERQWYRRGIEPECSGGIKPGALFDGSSPERPPDVVTPEPRPEHTEFLLPFVVTTTLPQRKGFDEVNKRTAEAYKTMK